jgi:predicted nucleic acid-binding protein
MVCLDDTNVLLRYADRTNPQHRVVRSAVRKLKMQRHQLVISPQNCAEFWNTGTRPIVRNGFGWTVSEARLQLRLIERAFPVILDVPEIYSEWKKIVVAYGVSGVQVHDARLVAVMKAHGISHILTFNTTDFARYAPLGIVAIDPATV